jgi:hypothetical protein
VATFLAALFRAKDESQDREKLVGKSSKYFTAPDCAAIDTAGVPGLKLNCQTKLVSRSVNAFPAAPARQSLARDLTPVELALAQALENIFATGQHSLAEVAAELQQRGVAHPSGAHTPWTLPVLEEELRRINSSLDAAYRSQAGGEQP